MKLADDAILRALDRRAGREGCPSADRLAAAAQGQLSADERETLADHLIVCADCAEECRLGAPIGEWAAETAERVESGRARRSGAEGRAPAWPKLLAAALLVGLGFGAGRVWPPPSPPSGVPAEPSPAAVALPRGDVLAPQVNVPIFDLSTDSVRSAGSRAIQWPATADQATFVLNLAAAQPRDLYALLVRAENGREVLRAAGLARTPFATVTLSIPRRLLPPGGYTLELRGPDAAVSAPALEAYRIDVK